MNFASIEEGGDTMGAERERTCLAESGAGFTSDEHHCVQIFYALFNMEFVTTINNGT